MKAIFIFLGIIMILNILFNKSSRGGPNDPTYS